MKLSEEIVDLGNSLGIPRSEMPQIDAEHMEDFLKYIHSSGRDYERCSISAKDLMPSQNELDTDKADKIWNEEGAFDSPIIVSGDNYVLDGHHRWLAVLRNDSDAKMECIKLSDNAKPALELMHGYEKSKKIDIEDKLVEMKLSKQILKLIEDDSESEVSNIYIEDIDVDEEEGCTFVSFVSEEDDGTELLAVFFNDEELGPVVSVIDDESDFDKEEVDVIALKEYNPPVGANGLIDFTKNTSWITDELLGEILSFDQDDSEDYSWITDSDDSIEERTITVIRGGKKVRKTIIRKKRKKRLSAKRKQSIKRGVRKKKAKKAQIQRKRKRSLKVRKRAKLKSKPKNQRVVG